MRGQAALQDVHRVADPVALEPRILEHDDGVLGRLAVFLFITITIARAKGRSALFWGILACFFPLITIIIVLLLPPRPLE